MRGTLIVIVFAFFGVSVAAQQTALKVDVRVRGAGAPGESNDARPVRDADVVVNGVTYHADADGSVVIPVAPGRVEIVVVKSGFAAVHASVAVPPNQPQPCA